MALTPEGSPYVQSSDLVATYPTTSLALANRVDLVGVLPFATSAARATAIPSPTDGQYSYLQDTNLTQFWNGSAWQTAGLTPGLTLVTPTSIANSGGTSSASGGQVTFTGVSSISINGCFSATYDNYLVLVRNSWANASTVPYLDLRLRLSGTDSAVSYSYVLVQAFTSIAVDTNANNTTLARIIRSGDINDGLGAGKIDIFAPFLAQRTSFLCEASLPYATTSNKRVLSSADHSAATSYDGFSLIPSASTITGTLRVYGYQNS